MSIRRYVNRRSRPAYPRTTLKYYSFGVNYNNCPDVFEYIFKATSAEEVSRATGVDVEYISRCTMADIDSAIRRGKHIDTVINGRLIDPEPC